ncbi:MAG: TraB/GumN family protein [Saprospiraceae bacterium]|nr:TraB/GumN family protein [Saprospiraceae bacterium]
MHIKNYISYFLMLFIAAFLISFSACKSAKEMGEQAEESVMVSPEKLDNALLWKVEGNGITQPSYVYGTIHIIGKEDFFLPEGTLGAIEASDKMVFEIDMAEMSDISKQMGLLKEVFMKDNMSLKDLISDEEYTMVKNHFQKMGLPIMMFERMKPMFLTVFAGEGMDINGLQTGSMKSYEMEFYEMAQQSDKGVGGLETMEYQMSMFDSIPYQVQADMLIETIKSSDAGSDQFRMMIDLYKSQDINSMVSMISEEDSGMQGFETLLVDQRNMNWIPLMKDMMIEGPVFFAVGAGHLAGKNGVIPLLMKEGYKLTPLSNAPATKKI